MTGDLHPPSFNQARLRSRPCIDRRALIRTKVHFDASNIIFYEGDHAFPLPTAMMGSRKLCEWVGVGALTTVSCVSVYSHQRILTEGGRDLHRETIEPEGPSCS